MTLSRAVNTADVELRGPDCSNQGLALYSWTGPASRYSHPKPHMQSQKQRHARNLPSAVQWPGKRRSLLHIMVSILLLEIFVMSKFFTICSREDRWQRAWNNGFPQIPLHPPLNVLFIDSVSSLEQWVFATLRVHNSCIVSVFSLASSYFLTKLVSGSSMGENKEAELVVFYRNSMSFTYCLTLKITLEQNLFETLSWISIF